MDNAALWVSLLAWLCMGNTAYNKCEFVIPSMIHGFTSHIEIAVLAPPCLLAFMMVHTCIHYCTCIHYGCNNCILWCSLFTPCYNVNSNYSCTVPGPPFSLRKPWLKKLEPWASRTTIYYATGSNSFGVVCMQLD